MECYDTVSFLIKKNTFECPWLNDKVIRSFGKVSNEDITYLKEVTAYPPRFLIRFRRVIQRIYFVMKQCRFIITQQHGVVTSRDGRES